VPTLDDATDSYPKRYLVSFDPLNAISAIRNCEEALTESHSKVPRPCRAPARSTVTTATTTDAERLLQRALFSAHLRLLDANDVLQATRSMR